MSSVIQQVELFSQQSGDLITPVKELIEFFHLPEDVIPSKVPLA